MLYDSLKHPFEDIRMDWKTLWKSGLLKRLPEQEVQDAINDPKIPYWIDVKVKEDITGPIGTTSSIHYGDDFSINETVATNQFIASMCGYVPSSLEDQTLATMISETCHIEICIPLCAATNGMQRPKRAASALVTRFTNPKDKTIMYGPMTFVLQRLEKLYHKNSGSPFMVGNKITHADFWIYEAIEAIRHICEHSGKDGKTLHSLLFDPIPGLMGLHKRIGERPNMKKYIASGERPEWLTGTGIAAVNLGRYQDFVKACVELIQKRLGVHGKL